MGEGSAQFFQGFAHFKVILKKIFSRWGAVADKETHMKTFKLSKFSAS